MENRAGKLVIEWEKEGGLMGPHFLLLLEHGPGDESFLGHFYPDESEGVNLESFLEELKALYNRERL